MMRLALLILNLLFSVCLLAQQGNLKHLDRADAFYHSKQFNKAITEYEYWLHKNNSISVKKKLADCYVKTFEYDKAILLYGKIVSEDSNTDSTCLIYASLLKRKKEYALAKEQYKTYYHAHPDKPIYKTYADYCDSARARLNTPNQKIRIANLTKINSAYSDITPVKYKAGMVFSSNRESTLIRKKMPDTDNPLFDMYMAEGKDSLTYDRVTNFSGKLNTIHHECCASFTSDFKKIFYTRSIDAQPGDGELVKNTLKMFSAHWDNNSWQDPHAFRFNDSTHSYGQPTVEGNEELFFFSSDRIGGYGGTDIYVCFNIDQKWTDPINLGPEINTPYNELYPFIHLDGTLYFSSNRPEGIGGYDLYKASENENGDYGSIINLGYPINSPEDDLSIFWDPDLRKGFLSSNREGGLGLEDLYSIQVDE